MLSTLLSNKIPPKEKKDILQDKYGFDINEKLGKGVNLMCNLSDAIYDAGLAQGIEQGVEQGIEQGIAQGKEQGAEDERKALLQTLAESVRIEEKISEIEAFEKAKYLLRLQ